MTFLSPRLRPQPRGEGETFAAGRESEASRFLPTRRRVFPLPEGEGQGEGERGAERINAASFCAPRCRAPTHVCNSEVLATQELKSVRGYINRQSSIINTQSSILERRD